MTKNNNDYLMNWYDKGMQLNDLMCINEYNKSIQSNNFCKYVYHIISVLNAY